jgi:hypothetical protein
VFLNVRAAARVLPGSVIVSDRLSDLYRSDKAEDVGSGARLLCLSHGLHSNALARAMSTPSWALNLIQELTPLGDMGWLISTTAMEDRPLSPSDFSLIDRASGVNGKPEGNVRCTWPIRRYDDRQSRSGGLEWMEARLHPNATRGGIAQHLLRATHRLMAAATEDGAEFHVEQISIVLAKDAQSTNTCLTPRLHADEYYGHREAAIASLLERGWSENGGTWFLPTCYMTKYPDGDSIKPEDVTSARFTDVPVVHTNSGDVCIYDGMQDAAGKAKASRGLPHISGDLPGESSRLVVLMNHAGPARLHP